MSRTRLPAALHSMRFQLPAFLVVMGALIYSGSLVVALRQTVETGLGSREQAARSSLAAVSRFVADLQSRHEENSTREILAQLGAMSDLAGAAYVDGAGRVVGSTRLEDDDRRLGETPWRSFAGPLARMRLAGRPVTEHDAAGFTLVVLPVHSGGLDPRGEPLREGALLAKLDFRPLVAAVRRQTFRFYAYMAACSLLAVVTLILFLQRRVARPALRIAEAADRHVAGDRTARTGLKGGDELALAGLAFDRMAAQVDDSEGKLRRERTLLDSLLDALPVGVFAVDRADRRVLFANRRMQELGGVPLVVGTRLDQVDGRRERGMGADYPIEDLPVERAFALGRPVESDDLVYVHPDGARIPVVTVASPMNLRLGADFDSVIAVVQDRRALERAVAEVREWEERFQSASLATGQAVYESDLATGVCRFSLSLRDVFGWKPEEVSTNLTWDGLIHPADLERVNEEYAACRDERRVFEAAYRVRHRDGRWLWVRDRGVFHHDAAGRPVRMLGAVADVTEQRELELRLQQAQKMETVGTLAGGVAHDFNNQLTGVLGHLDLLGEDLPEDDPRQEHVRIARHAAERCAELTRGLLAFSRMLRSEVRPVDLNELVVETVALLRRVLPATIRLELAADPRLPRALVDPTQMQQVLLNLCVNARDAMPAGGVLSLSTAVVSRDEGGDGPGGAAPGAYVCVTVTDTGVGMTPEVQARIFEPFFTTKEVGAGTGLGLAMVYGIVAQHRGWVDVESAPGRGATFRVHVPAAAGEAPTDAQAAGRAAGAGARVPGLVMVVDDERVVRDYAMRLLERAGCRVLGAADGAEALEHLRRRPGEIEAVLIDLTMPGPPVRDVLRTMREIEPRMRVVVTSGYSQETARIQEIDGLIFLPKPYSAAELLAHMRGDPPAPPA